MADSDEKLHKIRHSLAHVMAAAVQEIYLHVRFGIGPVIENGFYYDFDFPQENGQPIQLTPEILPEIEKRMRTIIKKDLPVEHLHLPMTQAIKEAKVAGQIFKLELLEEIKSGKRLSPEAEADTEQVKKGEASFYRIGNFTDLCKGPHVKNTKELPLDGFKLARIAGAYWKGDSANPQMQRIYAIAYHTKKELEEHLLQIEEAQKRDHKKLGPKLELFFFDETAPGMPYWLPKGVILYNELINFWRKEHAKRGYQETFSPMLNKKELYVTSGHYAHYWKDMFVANMGEHEEYGIKAMNCPNAMTIFGFKPRSYKDLPLRLSDTDPLHRYELSGVLNGLLRVRQFRQDDAHIFVTEDQIEDEYQNVFEIVEKFYSIFDLKYSFRLGTRPKSFLGDQETWNKAESSLKKILAKIGQDFAIQEGDGAFYGPKIDILMKDALGREWQMGTIQLDFQQPNRFKLFYIDSHGKEKTPIAIHRVIYGSLERFIGILIEHYAGAFPVWLSPVQATIVPISDKFNDYAENVVEKMKEAGIRVEFDARSESVGKKIREAEIQKVPYILVIGEKEEKSKTVAVRQRSKGDLGSQKIDKFLEKILEEIEKKIQ